MRKCFEFHLVLFRRFNDEIMSSSVLHGTLQFAVRTTGHPGLWNSVSFFPFFDSQQNGNFRRNWMSAIVQDSNIIFLRGTPETVWYRGYPTSDPQALYYSHRAILTLGLDSSAAAVDTFSARGCCIRFTRKPQVTCRYVTYTFSSVGR